MAPNQRPSLERTPSFADLGQKIIQRSFRPSPEYLRHKLIPLSEKIKQYNEYCDEMNELHQISTSKLKDSMQIFNSFNRMRFNKSTASTATTVSEAKTEKSDASKNSETEYMQSTQDKTNNLQKPKLNLTSIGILQQKFNDKPRNVPQRSRNYPGSISSIKTVMQKESRFDPIVKFFERSSNRLFNSL